MKRLAKDWPLKLLAVAIAGSIWLRVVDEQKAPLDITVPLQLQNLPGNLILSDEVPSKVTLRLRGTRTALERIKPGDIDAHLDLSQAKEGPNFIQLTADDVRRPFGLEVSTISPPSLRLLVHKRMAKMVPVIPDVRGKPPDGFELRYASVTPREVEIEGPEEDVQSASEVTTEVVLLSGRTASFNERVAVDPKSTRLQIKGALSAQVEIIIAEKSVERTLRDVPISIRPAELSVLITPSRVNITISGPASAMARLQPDGVRAFVDLGPALVLAGPFALPPKIEISPKEIQGDIEIKAVEPAEVLVKLNPAAKPSRQALEGPRGNSIVQRIQGG